jgi:hypothetical protein
MIVKNIKRGRHTGSRNVIRGLNRIAKALGVDASHAHNVLVGKRSSPRLLAAYDDFVSPGEKSNLENKKI